MATSRTRIGLLLATTSAAALISGAAPQSARAQCYTGPFPFTNTIARTCILVANTSFSGNVVNSGTGTLSPGSPNGITVTNSTITGQVSNAGTISVTGSGIVVQNNSVVTNGIVNTGGITVGANGIVVQNVANFSGGINNNGGTITGPSGGNGILVTGVTNFSGGISNSGSITITSAPPTTGNGIVVSGVTNFSGGIANSGSITVTNTTNSGNGIVVNNVSAFSGGISNSGTISAVLSGILVGSTCGCVTISSFAGGIINNGTIVATGTSANGIAVSGVSTFTGGIVNNGTITVTNTSTTGILVQNVRVFSGGITNNGSITVGTSGNGITVSFVSNFSGGITNNGTISAGFSSNGILVQFVNTFTGGISNGGTITTVGTRANGILLQNFLTFAGGITNSGTIAALNAGIAVVGCGCVGSFDGGIFNSGTVTASLFGITVQAVSNFTGGITNTGTITAAPFSGNGIALQFISTFAGGIINRGTITAGVGISVLGVESFAGGINNGGTITAQQGIGVVGVLNFGGGILNGGSISGGHGISIGGIDTFSGGITNTGAISVTGVGISVACGCGGDVTTFSGDIRNNGTIAAGSTGIAVGTVSTFLGGITNTGTITAGFFGISLGSGGMSVFNSGTINAPVAILFSPGGGNTLTLGPGSNITGLVVGAGADTFQLGGTGSASFDVSTIGSQYTGFTTFNKVDGSTWTLTGTNNAVLPWTVQQGTLIVASGASLPNSPFTVQSGVLSVDGTVGPVAVNGGVLMGNGTLGGLSVGPGGTVAPGHSIGQLNINGPVSFATGSFYQVETNAGGQADKIVATGAATLSGGTVQALPQTGNYGLSTTYTILTANSGRTGTFSNVTSSAPFLIPSLSYDANDVFLTLTRNTKFFQNQAGTPNQQAVASALDTFPTGNALFLAAAKLTGGATQQALDRLSGEIHASVQSVMREDSLFFRQAIMGRLRQSSFERSAGPMASLGAGGPLAYANTMAGDTAVGDVLAYAASARDFPIKAPRVAPPLPERVWWVQGIGAWGKINGDGNAAAVNRNLGGVFTGFDQRFGDWVVGIAGGYTNSAVNISARASSANIDAAHLAAYAGTSFGAWNVRTGAAVTWDTIGTTRMIGFPGFFEQATARYSAAQGQVFGEVGYGMAVGRFAVEPFAGLAYVHLSSTSVTEAGGLAALAGGANKEDVGYSTLGVRAATSYVLADGKVLTPRGSLGWQHAFGTITPTANLAFQSAGIPFTIAGAPIARDAALVDAGLDLRVIPQMTFGVSYLGVLGNSVQDHSVKGNFNWRF